MLASENYKGRQVRHRLASDSQSTASGNKTSRQYSERWQADRMQDTGEQSTAWPRTPQRSDPILMGWVQRAVLSGTLAESAHDLPSATGGDLNKRTTAGKRTCQTSFGMVNRIEEFVCSGGTWTWEQLRVFARDLLLLIKWEFQPKITDEEQKALRKRVKVFCVKLKKERKLVEDERKSVKLAVTVSLESV